MESLRLNAANAKIRKIDCVNFIQIVVNYDIVTVIKLFKHNA